MNIKDNANEFSFVYEVYNIKVYSNLMPNMKNFNVATILQTFKPNV